MRPALVAHADWSAHPGKRWLAAARLMPAGGYAAGAPQPVGEPDALIERLLAAAGGGAVLLGLDLPVGLPAAYTRCAGVDDFPALLPQLGRGDWADFYCPAERPQDISLRRPFYPARPGGARRQHLLEGLGLALDELLRRCDRRTAERPAAAALFWTLGPQQVGKAAIAGWRDLLAPGLASGRLALWPFAGCLEDALRPGWVVAAETYPAECYRHLGVRLTGSKRSPEARRQAGPTLLAWSRDAGVALEPTLAEQIAGGFGARADGEDRFDAVVGLFGMLNVVLGRRAPGEPPDGDVRRVEGWILGQTA